MLVIVQRCQITSMVVEPVPLVSTFLLDIEQNWPRGRSYCDLGVDHPCALSSKFARDLSTFDLWLGHPMT